MQESATLLVLDPYEPSRFALRDLLRGLGYQVLLAEGGATAGRICASEDMDLLVLGRARAEGGIASLLAQCRAASAGQGMPVLVVAAAEERDAILEAIRAGADDFLIHPIDPLLLRVRIESLLSGKRMREHERGYRLQLESELQEKGRQLAEVNRKLLLLDHAKSDFLRLIAHEMRTPLNGLLGSIGVLFGKEMAQPEAGSPVSVLKSSAERLLNLVEDATLLSRLQVAERDTAEAAGANLRLVMDMALHRLARCPRLPPGIPLPALPPCDARVAGDEGLLMRAFQCLFQAMVLLSHEPVRLALECRIEEASVEVTIRTQGPPLAPEVVAHFFDLLPGHQVQVAGGNLGLLPALARRIVTLFDGELTLESLPPDRLALRVRLPLYQQEPLAGATGIFFTTSIRAALSG